MTPDLEARCQDLHNRGKMLESKVPRYEGRANCWVQDSEIADAQAWIASVSNFFRLCATPDSYFAEEAARIVENKNLAAGVPYHTVQKLIGLLQSIGEEMKQGLMRKAEYVFVASTFDDFLGHAIEYHKAEKKIESAVLASAVFEDAARRFGQKMNVAQAGRSLDVVIDDLVKNASITPVKAKRWKSYAGVRNSALHSQWENFDISDVGNMINGTREIIELL